MPVARATLALLFSPYTPVPRDSAIFVTRESVAILPGDSPSHPQRSSYGTHHQL